MGVFEDILKGKEDEKNKEPQGLLPARMPESKALVPYDEEARKILREMGIRRHNSIPEKVKLEITFHSEGFALGEYEYLDKKIGVVKKPGILTQATIKYDKKASNMVTDCPYPLALSKNNWLGLVNCIRAGNGNFNLVNRTFTVYNRNRQTYEWEEITKKEVTEI